MIEQLGFILVSVLLPILVLVAMGAGLQHWVRVDMPTLTRLTIWLLIPAFLFIKIYDSDLAWRSIGNLAVGYLLSILIPGVLLFFGLRAAKISGPTIACVLLGSLVVNAGNFGVPVAELLYRGNGVLFPGMNGDSDQGVQVHALIIMMANTSVWFFGYGVLALAKGDGLRGALGYFRLPMFYALALAFVSRHIRIEYCDGQNFLPTWIDWPLRQLTIALVPLMLIILGAQLATGARWPRWKVLTPIILLRLAVMPIVTGIVVYWLGLWPWPGAQLVIASAGPAAINTLLLTLELDGDADLQADVVFWTTVFSGASVTVVIAIVLALAALPINA